MSSRFSLGNLVRSISFDQFQALLSDFANHCSAAFGCECDLEIRAMRAMKVFTTHWPDDHVIKYMDELNERNTFFKTDTASALTAEIFTSAVFIEVFVRPKDATQAPPSAFGYAEFKGKQRRLATFYVQPEAPQLFEKMTSNNRFMLVGDGYAYHCDPG